MIVAKLTITIEQDEHGTLVYNTTREPELPEGVAREDLLKCDILAATMHQHIIDTFKTEMVSEVTKH